MRTSYSTPPACPSGLRSAYPLRGAKRLSLTFTKAQTVAGRVLYDAFGGVLTRTLPLTGSGGLTTTLSPAMIDLLAGQGTTDPDTDLVYLGNGRYFDPLLGLPLQPNPVGGAPTVPQSLNRYAATSLGPPGVGEASASNTLFSTFEKAVFKSALTYFGFRPLQMMMVPEVPAWGPLSLRMSRYAWNTYYNDAAIRTWFRSGVRYQNSFYTWERAYGTGRGK